MLKCWQALLTGATGAGLFVLFGCSSQVVDSGPSYAELVVTYNAELAALDRLEAKREKLVKEFEAESAPAQTDAGLSKLEGLLESAKDLKNDGDLETPPDPDAFLDQLTERTGDAEQIAGQLLDGLLGDASNAPEPTAEEIAAAEKRKAEFEAELASLDAEIAVQQERADRARAARDAAEAESRADR